MISIYPARPDREFLWSEGASQELGQVPLESVPPPPAGAGLMPLERAVARRVFGRIFGRVNRAEPELEQVPE